MCGYIGRVTDNPFLQALLIQLGLEELFDPLTDTPSEIEQFYPAFGSDPKRMIRGLIIEEEGVKKLIDATWWFDCEQRGEELVVGKMTTFNARNLNSPYWKNALKHHRGIVVATELGESKWQGKKKHQYLMHGQQPFLMGALYRKFPNGKYSCAVITRDSHPKFEPYHDKAFPLFLPPEQYFIDLWLNKKITVHRDIDALLHSPKLYPELKVAEVKTFKSGKRIGDELQLSSDLSLINE